MFQLKNFVSIAASMLNYVRSTTGKVTDLQPGSVTRTILEAPASEIEELYLQMFNGIKEAIPVAVYNSIKFDKLAPQFASGRVTVTAKTPPTQDMKVSIGTRFLTADGRTYISIADTVWQANFAQWDFPVISTNTGVSQNAAADMIVSSPTFPPDQYQFNSTPMLNGSDLESDDSRNIRFADYIRSLSRGTEAALLYGASTATITDAAGNITESVIRTALTTRTGSVTVYIWGSNGAPSAALQQRVRDIESGYRDSKGDIIPGYAAAGISCSVSNMLARPIDATIVVTLTEGETMNPTMQTAIKNALGTRLSQVMPGDTVTVEELRVATLIVPGIQTAELLNVNNIVCGVNEVLTIGNVVVR